MTQPAKPPQPRPQVPGHRVDALIGQGAFSTVWSGADATGRPVAIKVPTGPPDEQGLARGLLERHVLMAVRHEHLVSLRDVVELDDGRSALVFDLVRGVLLSALVGARGHLQPGETVTVVSPVCEAVAALHAAGGVHGDISARNVMVRADGRPVLLDLGASRIAGHGSDDVHGTPGFVAPEVRSGDVPTEASDVFSLGALAWFCLTGNGAPDTLLRLDPDTVRSHVGPELGQLVARCIDPDPSLRPSSGEVARLFFDATAPEPVEVVVGGDDASALTHRLRAAAASEAQARPRGSRRWPGIPGEAMGRLAGRVPGGVPVGATVAATLLAVLAGGGWALVATAGEGSAAEGTRAAPVATGPRPAPGQAPEAPASRGTSRPTPSGPVHVPSPTASGAASPASPSATSRSTVATRVLDVVVDPEAPRARAHDLVQALADARAAALVARDEGRLATVDHRGSPAWQLDANVIAALRDKGVRWEGLSLQVARATFVSGSGTTATIRARVDWTAYVVVHVDGTREARSADMGEELDLELVRVAAGWRIAAVSEPPAT